MHWADAFAPDVAVNAVTNDAVDAESLQPEFKVCAVALTAVETDAPPAQPTPLETTAPVDALAAALGPLPSSVTLNADEQLFLSGFVAGVRANPPTDAMPTLPAATPLAPANRAWVDGVLAGIFSRTVGSTVHVPVASGPAATVVWASQTGTAEEFATTCVERLNGAGITARLRGADEISLSDLYGTVLFVVSTTGDGEPPDNGIALWNALAAAEPGDVDSVDFSVLGFGDSSYTNFCGFARRLDARLDHLGAHRIVDRASCEPDFEATAQAWTDHVVAALTGPQPSPVEPKPAAAPSYSRANPLRTTIASNVALCGAGSDKDVRNIGIHLPDGTLDYGPGDALGVWPHNRPEVVVEFLERTRMDGSAEVTVGDETTVLAELLCARMDITRITPDLIRFLHERRPSDELAAVIEDPAHFAEWSRGRQALDLLAIHPVEAELEEWLGVLRPLTPRLYSISSSPLEDPTQVHVTTSVVRFESTAAATDGAVRHGVCSGYLANLAAGAEVEVFVQRTKHFRPPQDPDTPVIMVGPGTGIAPFRGFLHDRAARGHAGANWLFFGERHEASEFYYRDELDAFRRSGVLTRLDTAFSRDSATKLYVQDRMRESAAELWKWIADGAHLYVCGDASRMARDVDEALRGIVAEHGGRSPKSAVTYLQAMSAEGRYVRDVY
jgi:sulfite reductase (NADPH) flavoprotein alpha-component